MLVGYLSNTYINRIERISALSTPINQFINGLHTIRNYEKDFLFFDRQSEIFFVSGNSIHIDVFDKHYLNNQVLIESVSENIFQEISDSTLRLRFKTIEAKYKMYYNFFHSLEKSIRSRGYNDYGLIGDWKKKENEIYSKLEEINDIQIHDVFMQITRCRYDYLQDNNPTHLSELKRIIKTGYEQIDNDTLSLLDSEAKAKNLMFNEFEDYADFGEKVYNIDNHIGLVGEQGLLQDIQQISEDIESETFHALTKVEGFIKHENKLAQRKLTAIIFLIGTITIIFIGYLSRSILNPIYKIEAFIRKLTKGKFPDKVNLTTQDEIKDMLGALNKFVDSMKEKTLFASEIGKGKFSMKFKALSKDDKLGNALLLMQKSLAKASDAQRKLRIEEETRNWTSEGMTKFADILRENSNNPHQLAKNVIANLVKYLNTNLGAVFFINDLDSNDKFLEQISTFAYDRIRNEQKRVEPDEGLIGRCVNEKKIIYMTDVPKDYITITSGLGEDTPRMLVIVPLISENKVLGVIEMAGLYKLERFKLDFLNKFSDNFASTISTVKVNERTNTLLEQTRQQTEEMAAQEEEMRQNLEELQATQEDAARKEAEMNSIFASIDASTYAVEYDIDGKLIKVNPIVCKITGRKPEQLIGTYHSDYIDFDFENKDEYKLFWKEVISGKIVKRVTRRGVENNFYWLQETYSPILNYNEKVERILNIAFDITEMKELEIKLSKEKEKFVSKKTELEAAIDKLKSQKTSLKEI